MEQDCNYALKNMHELLQTFILKQILILYMHYFFIPIFNGILHIEINVSIVLYMCFVDKKVKKEEIE